MKFKGFKLFTLAIATFGSLALVGCNGGIENEKGGINWTSNPTQEYEKGNLIVGLDADTSKKIASNKITAKQYFDGTNLKIETINCLDEGALSNPETVSELDYLLVFEDKSDVLTSKTGLLGTCIFSTLKIASEVEKILNLLGGEI